MNRLFTFGCSFTCYHWPTWADILGQDVDYYENWGASGSGNLGIFNAVTECLVKNKLTSNDTVMVMWTDIFREDRYINNKWNYYGNLLHQDFYNKSFIKKYADIRGFLIRDLACIHATRALLSQSLAKWYFISMVPINTQVDNIFDPYRLDMDVDSNADVLRNHAETIASIRPSMYEKIFNFDWFSRPMMDSSNSVKEFYKTVAGPDWPSWDSFLKKDFKKIDKNIVDEVTDEPRWGWNAKKRYYGRTDIHPTPGEHLEYIQTVLPEFTISNATLDWVDKHDYVVRTEKIFQQDKEGKTVEFHRHLPTGRW